MSDVTIVEIKNADQFRAAAKTFGVPVGERGALPRKALLIAVRAAVAAGTHELVETPFFGVDAVLGSGTPIKRGDLAWTISFTTKNPETGDESKGQADITAKQIHTLLPNANLQGRSLSNTVALVMVASLDGASVAELVNYTVTGVARKAESVATPVVEAPKGEDTPETVPDADKATETPEDVKPDAAPVVEVTPELVPADTAKPAKAPAKPRAPRKTAAKSAAK